MLRGRERGNFWTNTFVDGICPCIFTSEACGTVCCTMAIGWKLSKSSTWSDDNLCHYYIFLRKHLWRRISEEEQWNPVVVGDLVSAFGILWCRQLHFLCCLHSHKSAMSTTKLPNWKPEGEDAALFARGINSGDVTDSKNSYDAWLPKQEDLCKRYGVPHNDKGVRKLRNNFLKLYKKITLWKAGAHGKKKNQPLLYVHCLAFPQSASCCLLRHRSQVFRVVLEERQLSATAS